MIKNLLFFIAGFVIILSCKKDNGSTDGPSTGGGSDKDWTISTSSTFLLKDMLDVVYVQDNKNDERLESIVTLSKLANKNNPNLKGEFQFVIDYDGKSNLNISQPIAFTNADFISNESIEKKVSIVLLGNTSKIGTIKMKMREKLNDKWTEYKYADKVYQTAYVKAVTPTIEGPDQVEKEGVYKIFHAEEITLENADKIATLSKVSDNEWKLTVEGVSYGRVVLKATNKDKISVVKEVTIGVPLPEITGPEFLDNEGIYTINNATEVILEKADKIASLTKISDTQYKITKVGTAYGKITIKATNKAGATVTKEVTVGVPLSTIVGAASFETEATYTIANAATVVLENNNNIASLTKISDTQYKVIKIGAAYGKLTIKATNKAGATATKEITVGIPLPTISGLASFETESTYTIMNATTVVLENNSNIATLTKVNETTFKVTKIGAAYGKVTIKAMNSADAVATKEVTIGLPLPTITGATSFESEATYTIANAVTVVLENASNIASLIKISDTQYKITKVGTAYGKIKIKATNKAGVTVTKEITVGVPLPTITGAASFETESTYTITNATTVVLENNSNIATLTKVNETTYKVTKIGIAYGKVTIKATNKAGATVTKAITVGTAPIPAPTIEGLATVCKEEIYTIKNATNVTLENATGIATLASLGNDQYRVTKVGNGNIALKATNISGVSISKILIIGGEINIVVDRLDNFKQVSGNDEFVFVSNNASDKSYSGRITLENLNSAVNLEYFWTMSSEIPSGAVFGFNPEGNFLDIYVKGISGVVDVKCTITSACAIEIKHYKIYIGVSPLL